MKKIFNKKILLWYTGLYTIATILNSILYLAQGYYEDPNGNWHELDRAIIVLALVLGITLYKKLELKNKFFNLICSYIPTLVLSLLYIFFRGLFDELAKSAYTDMFTIITMFFVLIALIDFIISIFKNKKQK